MNSQCVQVSLCKSYNIKTCQRGLFGSPLCPSFGVPISSTEHLFVSRIISLKTVFLQSVFRFKNKENSVRQCIWKLCVYAERSGAPIPNLPGSSIEQFWLLARWLFLFCPFVPWCVYSSALWIAATPVVTQHNGDLSTRGILHPPSCMEQE